MSFRLHSASGLYSVFLVRCLWCFSHSFTRTSIHSFSSQAHPQSKALVAKDFYRHESVSLLCITRLFMRLVIQELCLRDWERSSMALQCLDRKFSTSSVNFNVPLSVCFVNVSRSLKSGFSTKKYSIIESTPLVADGMRYLLQPLSLNNFQHTV